MLQLVNWPARALRPLSGPSLLPWSVFSVLYVASVAALCLRSPRNSAGNNPFSHILTPFAVGTSMHLVHVMYKAGWNRAFPPNGSMGRIQRMHTIFRICTDFRGLCGKSAAVPSRTNTRADEDRLAFGVVRLIRLLSLMELHRIVNRTMSHILGELNISIRDFASDRQGLLPPIRRREMCTRAVISYHWIWSTYAILTSAHDLFAILFVVILDWDRPDEWPSLHGSIADAYSLCRFLGGLLAPVPRQGVRSVHAVHPRPSAPPYSSLATPARTAVAKHSMARAVGRERPAGVVDFLLVGSLPRSCESDLDREDECSCRVPGFPLKLGRLLS